MNIRTQFGVVFTFLTLMFSSCSEDSDFQPDFSRYTVFRVLLTDNPTNLEEVNIDLKEVEIIGRGQRNTKVLDTDAGIYNLLDYQNGLTAVIAGAILEDFDYIQEVRLILGDENSVKAGGEVFPLKVSSGSSSGLKIKTKTCIDLTETMNYDLILDFDAEKSVKQNGKGDYRLVPVIKALNEDADCG